MKAVSIGIIWKTLGKFTYCQTKKNDIHKELKSNTLFLLYEFLI